MRKHRKKDRKGNKSFLFFFFLVKKLPLHSFEFSSSYYPWCSFDASFGLEGLLQDTEGCCVRNELSLSSNECAASG